MMFIKICLNIRACKALRYRLAIHLLLLCGLAGGLTMPLRAQPPPPLACIISGSSSVSQGASSAYTLSGSGCTAASWSVTCGTIQSSNSSSVTVLFNGSGGCTQAGITALNGSGGNVASKTVTVVPGTLTGGTISNTSQTVNYDVSPSAIDASVGIGGTCGGYSFQWYSSTNGSTYTSISGATSQNYQPGALTVTTYFKRETICGSSTAYTTNVATVTVYPEIVPGTITPTSQSINYNTVPSGLSISTSTGGNGSYSYQWNSCPNTSFSPATYVGTNSTTYSPPALTSTTYYRVVVVSNSATVPSVYVVVNVYPQLITGTVGPAQSINYNTTPSTLSLTGTTGGTGVYTYQWQYCLTSNGTYTTIGGATASSYAPGLLTATTYYEVVTTSNGVSVTSLPMAVTVYPQLVSGTITPSSQTINFNTSPSSLTISAATGGNGTYSYSWQSSNSSSGTYAQVGTGTGYSPGILAATTWYEVVSTSNGAIVTSAPVAINVNPQVVPGAINPSTNVIASGTSPGTLTSTPATGGTCGSFYYQWQSAPDNVTWTNITGATWLTYKPGNLSATVYYRVLVTCSTDSEYTSSAEISIGAINTDLNYIRTRMLSKSGVTDTVTADGLTSPYDVLQATQYYDGMGRTVQTVAKQATPLQKDLVITEAYDNFGRESIGYLPYGASTNDGNFKPTALADQASFDSVQFPNEQYYYGQTTYEASFLNRPLQTDAPGISWIGSDRGVSSLYLINTQSDSVQLWSISSQQLALPVNNGAYPAGQLFKMVTTDENGNQSVVYKDKLGKTILAKIQASASPSSGHAGWLCTYYVYDTLQSLRFIMQPQAVALINGSWLVSQGIANELCFRYEYDGRRRPAIKKTPGAGQQWLVFDARGRLAMVQDSALRALQKWMFTKYDLANRPDSVGFITDPVHSGSLAYHDSLAYYSINYPVVGAFTNELLVQSFYDDYSWVSTYGAPVASSMATNYTSNSNYFITSYNVSPTYAVAITPFAVTRGMQTGLMKKVIGTSSQYLYTVNFYDDRGRTIQTQSVNYTGAIDTATVQYNFSGAVLRTLVNHQKNSHTAQSHTVLTKMDYDQSFRLRHIWKNIDGAASDQLIDSLQYNELGQLRAKYLGNSLDSLIYDYNIRGWLTGINKKYVAGTANNYFGMELGYDKTSSAAPGNSYILPEYNGNAEGAVWKSAGSGINRKYDYAYDNAGRLKSAAFLQNTTDSSWDNSQIDFTVGNLTYDANGNILTMEQKGYLAGGSQLIDQLKYSYQSNSNKLSQVYDTANNPTTLLGDFHWTGAKPDTDYYYDGNGNLLQDKNRGISTITYNYLNLPQLVHMNGKGNITYTYDAGGTKLSKVITDSVTRHSVTILYIGAFVYQQTDTINSADSGADTLQYIIHEEGRARWAFHKYTTGSTAYKLEYDFFEKDHLGNTRMVLTQEKDTTNYLASMEAANRTTESQVFGNIASTCAAWTSMPNYQNIPNNLRFGVTSPNDSVSKVDSTGAGGQKTGPSLLLKVMSGDTINMAVQCYYNSNTITTTNSSFNDVLNSLAAGLVSTATGNAEGTLSSFTSSTGPVYSALNSFLPTRDSTPSSGYPKAYLNWIFLDDQFNYVSSSSGAVAAASTNNSAGQLNCVAPGAPLNITKNGYLYIWVSNETQGWDVFFDNLCVQYKQGPLLEENHYYPFGLTMAGISDKAVKTQYAENKYRYNGGSELQNREFGDGTGLELYESGFRSYDQQIGRFFQMDPMAEQQHSVSTYEYAADDPTLLNDPVGLMPRNMIPHGPAYGYANNGPVYYDDGTADMDATMAQWASEGFGPDGQMWQGGGSYQLPDGQTVGIDEALEYARQNYTNSYESYTGMQAQLMFIGMQIAAYGQSDNIVAKTVYNYGSGDGLYSYETNGYHGLVSNQNGGQYMFLGASTNIGVVGLDGDDEGSSISNISEGHMNTYQGLAFGATLTDLTTITPTEKAAKYIAGAIYGVKELSKAKSLLSTAQKFEGVSKGLAGLNIFLTALDAATDPNGPQLHHGIDLAVGVLSYACPVFGIIYGIADVGSIIFTRKSISEHIQDVVEN
jgi:RHS repeat-associated protein